MKKNKGKKSLFFILTLFVLLVIGALIWWRANNEPVASGNFVTKNFEIRQGEGIDEIGQKLFSMGLIKSKEAFKIKIIFLGIAKNIQAGTFWLSPSMNLEAVVKNLTKGLNDEWVTIPEGLRAEEVGEILSQKLKVKSEKFVRIAKPYEGYLFPDTYLFPLNYNEEQILETLRNTFDKKITENFGEDIKSKIINGFSFRESVILASLVEREARTENDRAIVAGILIRRLKGEWPLQVDATVQYLVADRDCVLGTKCEWWPKEISLEDLNIDSPYNSYRNAILPPAPICDPSLSALKAVLVPAKTDYWYYISDTNGKMHYARTIDEHNTNISKYLTK